MLPSPKAQVHCPTESAGVVRSVNVTGSPMFGLVGVQVNSGTSVLSVLPAGRMPTSLAFELPLGWTVRVTVKTPAVA